MVETIIITINSFSIGATKNASESNAKLRAANVPIVNQEVCNEQYQNEGGVTPRMVCAGYPEGGKGDSNSIFSIESATNSHFGFNSTICFCFSRRMPGRFRWSIGLSS